MHSPENTLHYDSPATEWLSALPLGNGKLASMVFGGSAEQKFQINDGLAWSGSPETEGLEPIDPAKFAATLAEVRAQLEQGDYIAANETVKGLQHRHSQTFLPFGQVQIAVAPHGEVTSYSRSLDLSTAVHQEKYRVAEGTVEWTSFISVDPAVLVIRLHTDVAAGLDLDLTLTSRLRVLASSYEAQGANLTLQTPADVFPPHDDGGSYSYSDDPKLSTQGALAVRWEHDGTSDATADALSARGVHDLTIYVATQTTLEALGATPAGDAASSLATAQECLSGALSQPYDEVLDRHVRSHGELFGRVTLTLGAGDSHPELASDKRLLVANQNPAGPIASDPGLATLLFNYGRYLLICSSRAGGAPANLQGIWNDDLPVVWSSNYTTNINVEMNYWAAQAVGLQDCVEPLFGLIDVMQITGARTARDLYQANGWTGHHNADIWGYSRPVGHGRAQARWALWPMASLWLVQHLWDHIRFANPEDPATTAFIRDRAWPAIRGAAEFGLDWLVELPDGTLGTIPSTSPENGFMSKGKEVEVGISSTMDLTLLREIFGNVADIAAILDLQDDAIVTRAAAALPRIPKPSVGRAGQIREWLEDNPQSEPDHRHVSHLWFLYPGDRDITPELKAGANATLDGRGDESTGWSLSWKIALRARLGQGGKVDDLLRLVFRDMTVNRGGQSGGLYANFFAAHPPFQMDGNFGYVAGLVEALQQSHTGELELLPALPTTLPEGAISGLRARGGITTSLAWSKGVLVSAKVTSPTSRDLTVRYGDKTWNLTLVANVPQDVPVAS